MCISNRGEHHMVTHGPECFYCGKIPPNPTDALRAALVAIQELHKPVREWPSYREHVLVCGVCMVYAPCPTRRLADEALGRDTDG